MFSALTFLLILRLLPLESLPSLDALAPLLCLVLQLLLLSVPRRVIPFCHCRRCVSFLPFLAPLLIPTPVPCCVPCGIFPLGRPVALPIAVVALLPVAVSIPFSLPAGSVFAGGARSGGIGAATTLPSPLGVSLVRCLTTTLLDSL